MKKKLVLLNKYGRTYVYKGFTDDELDTILHRHLTEPHLKDELKEWEMVYE